MSFENLVKYFTEELLKQPFMVFLFIMGIIYIVLEIMKKRKNNNKSNKVYYKRRR